MDDLTDWPEGFEALEIDEVTFVALEPETGRVIILTQSSVGQKIAVMIRAADLARINITLQRDIIPQCQPEPGQTAH